MKKVDLNFDIKPFEDSIVYGNAGKVLANFLLGETKGDAIKLFDWAIKLGRNEFITLDKSDFETLKNLVVTTEKLAIVFKAPILNYLNDCKEDN